MRIFVSHSSKDKERYVNKMVKYLIEQIGESSVIYDALSFEVGEKSIDEINRNLANTDLFVILLSKDALESNWVKYELGEAYKKLSENTLNRIYPLIIDSELKYDDKRIPNWLKEYTLKYIARPRKSAKLIIERAKNINWSRHPAYKNRDSIFVGRNDLINSFETRIDDFEEPPLNSFIVSGLPNIGRKSLVRQCLIKGNIIQPYYEFPTISLSYQESIEDFIIKSNDLGFTDESLINNLPSKTLEEKINCATTLAKEIVKLSEILLIKDDGCIVDYRGRIADWFKEIVSSNNLNGKISFIVVTKHKTSFETIRNIPSATFLNVPELSRTERNGLLKRLAEQNNLNLNRTEFETISKHLTGYPAQVHYAIEIIKDQGYPYLSKNFKFLSDYNEQQVSLLLEEYKEDERVLNLLALVARYDAISVTMLYDILEQTEEYIALYEKLYQDSLFELEGVNKEYVRLNEVVRNYITRSGAKPLVQHQKRAQVLLEEIFSDDNSPWYDSNDFLLAIRENIICGKRINPQYIIPSVYLKSMQDLYSDMKYDNILTLAKLALDNTNNTDEKILYEIRYLFCLTLAKLRHSDFLKEVRNLENDERKFLTAFYYRQIGKNSIALNYLNELLEKRPEMSKAKREKVLVLKNLQEFEEAMGLAKENFYLYSDNPYHIQAYFDCLINTYHDNPQDNILDELLEKLNRIQSEKARSMYRRCYALYLAYVEKNFDAAQKEINLALEEFPNDKRYALTVKFDIARLFKRTAIMEQVIKSLESDGITTNTLVICKSKLLADQGDIDGAVEYFSKHISYFTDESKQAFCEKLKSKY